MSGNKEPISNDIKIFKKIMEEINKGIKANPALAQIFESVIHMSEEEVEALLNIDYNKNKKE